MKKKIMYDVNPFNNKIMGDNNYCFWVDLFTALCFFNYDINYILTNSYISLEEKDDTISTKLNFSVTNNEIYKFFNIKLLKLNKRYQLISTIQEELNKGNLIIIYLFKPKILNPFIKEKCEMDMGIHSILINGYDCMKNIFYCIDHTTQTSFIYKQCGIRFKNLYKSFKYVFKKHSDSIIIIEKDGKKNSFNSETTLVRNIKNNSSILLNNLNIIINNINLLNFTKINYYSIDTITIILDYLEHEKRVLSLLQLNNINDTLFNLIKHVKLLRALLFKIFSNNNIDYSYRFEKEKSLVNKGLDKLISFYKNNSSSIGIK